MAREFVESDLTIGSGERGVLLCGRHGSERAARLRTRDADDNAEAFHQQNIQAADDFQMRPTPKPPFPRHNIVPPDYKPALPDS